VTVSATSVRSAAATAPTAAGSDAITAALVGKEDAIISSTTQASWVLITAFTVSALYELFRSTAKAGTSRYDSTRWLLTQGTPFYVIGFGLAVLVRTGWP
jgi:hypothetical protein